MHWLVLLMYAFLYALVGGVIGVAYALLTGADMASFEQVVTYAGFVGPIVILMIVAFRRITRKSVGRLTLDVPTTSLYYMLLLAIVAAPVLMYGGQLIAGALDAPKVARLFHAMKSWSILTALITVVLYDIWRIVEGNRLRASASGTTGGTPPAGSGTPGGQQPATAQRAMANGSPNEPTGTQRFVTVACFSSRGTPFRLIRRLA